MNDKEKMLAIKSVMTEQLGSYLSKDLALFFEDHDDDCMLVHPSLWDNYITFRFDDDSINVYYENDGLQIQPACIGEVDLLTDNKKRRYFEFVSLFLNEDFREKLLIVIQKIKAMRAM